MILGDRLACTEKFRVALIAAALTGGLLVALAVSNAQTSPANNGTSPTGTEFSTLDEAKSLADANHLTEAESKVRRYLDTHASSADAHFLLGYILFRAIQARASQKGRADPKFEQENAKASLAEYTLGAKFKDPSAFDLKIVALDCVLLHDYVDADKWLTKSVELDPNNFETWYYLGRARYNEERFQDAIPAFQKGLALDPHNVKAEDNLGLSYAALNRRDEAVAAYQKAIGWQADSLIKDSGPYIDLGTLLLDENRAEEAVGYLSQGAAISPEESRGHAGLGRAYSKLNNLPKAQDELEKAVLLAPDNGPLHYVLGQVYRKQGLLDKANAEFDRSTQLNGSHSSPVNDLPGRR
jgi:tetratricopeptide (TPR) repeat protein